MGRNEWESALKLSMIWGMSDVRNVAIENLADDIDSMDRILLGQAYGVPDWLLSGCKTLAERDEPISGQEGRRLGPDIAVKLCQIREAGIKASIQPAPSQARCKNHFKAATEKYDYEDRIRSLFSEELADAEATSRTMVGTARLESQHIDQNSEVPLNSQPEQNVRFYMECIVFLVRK
jgi:hypothetical protein